MSFTSDLKKEIISRNFEVGKEILLKKAALSAYVKVSGVVGMKEGEPVFYIVSETENVAECFMKLFFDTFGFELQITRASMDRMSGRDKLILQCDQSKSKTVLKTLGLLSEDGKMIETGIANEWCSDAEKIAFIQGAFLGGGRCTLPSGKAKTGYHLEIVFSERETAEDFCDLLSEFELLVKLVERKETQVVYIKSKEMISDFLAVIGVENTLRKFSDFVKRRDEANWVNRSQNCAANNADKAAIASVNQVKAIQLLEERGVLSDLSDELQTLARARKNNASKTLQELADTLCISKSCLNHRMRKLMELAKKLEE